MSVGGRRARPTLERPAIGSLFLAALTLAACGGGGPRADLARSVTKVGQVRAGTVSMRLTLTPTGAPPSAAVGIVLRGPFALDRRRPLPVMDITYTRLAGPAQTSATLVSDGHSAQLHSAGRVITLTAEQRQTLAAALQGPQGLGDLPLHVDRWIEHPRSSPGPVIDGQPTERIVGGVDVKRAATDLQQLGAGTLSQAGHSPPIDLAGVERRSQLEGLVGRRDGILHRLDMTVTLAPPVGSRAGAAAVGVEVALALALSPRAS